MKKVFKPFMMIATIASLFAVSSCTKDDREKFEGSWSAVESGPNAAPYTATIAAGSGASDLSIGNFSGTFQHAVTATVSGDGFTIGLQEPDGDGYTVQGTGAYAKSGSTETIAIDYTVISVADTINAHYTGTWTK